MYQACQKPVLTAGNGLSETWQFQTQPLTVNANGSLGFSADWLLYGLLFVAFLLVIRKRG